MEMILNLKEHPELVPEYVELRNRYTALLLTQPVELLETVQWINNTTAEIRVIKEENSLLGVVIVYLDRGGEIAFFARNRNKGIGSSLLKIADEVARIRKIPSLWAWVREDNPIAVRVFEKCGYRQAGVEERVHEGRSIRGTRHIKNIVERKYNEQ